MRDDPDYLKTYVKHHPDNQMAWYLLGRSYAAKGEESKAEYCFERAGEVYIAFEKESMSDQLDLEQVQTSDEKSFQEQQPDHRGYKFFRRAVLTLIFFFLLFALPYSLDTAHLHETLDKEIVSEVSLQSAEDKEDDFSPIIEKAPTLVSDHEPEHEPQKIHMLYMDNNYTKRNIYSLLGGARNATKTYVLQADWVGDTSWVDWLTAPRWLLSFQANSRHGTAEVHFYDEDFCECIPADLTSLEPAAWYDQWSDEQLQMWILDSAIEEYIQEQGEVPTSIQDLARDYPYNIMPGYTDHMKLYFNELAQQNMRSKPDDESTMFEDFPEISVELFPGKSSPQEKEDNLSESTQLEIIVDTENHRLAVVKNQILIRNYPVGLGGDRTPLGEFVVSEKVKNPNGRSDGVFGSRGMTLSDTLYAIHGTNEPESIGQDESLGCIRMIEEDIVELFNIVPKGTKVTIQEGGLPDEIKRVKNPVKLPVYAEETNPGKRYTWLR